MKLTAQQFHRFKKRKGFTLIELLIVVSLLGVLAGLTITVINPTRQRYVTEDGVRRSNLVKLSQALESYCVAEGKCPFDETSTTPDITFGAVETPTLSDAVSVYVKSWPVGSQSTTVSQIKFFYIANSDTDPQNFEVNVDMMSSTNFLRYNSTWGKIMECTSRPTTSWSATCTKP